MSLVLDLRSRRRSRLPHELSDAVSLLRWRSGSSRDAVHEMFRDTPGGAASPDPGSAESGDGENVLLVSASRRVEPDAPAVLLSLANTSPSQAVKLSVTLGGRPPRSVTGTVLMVPSTTPCRTDAGQGNGPRSHAGASVFRGSVLKGSVVEITVPATSVVVLTLQ